MSNDSNWTRTVSGSVTMVGVQPVCSSKLPATSSTVLLSICRLVLLVLVAKLGLDLMLIKSAGDKAMMTSVTPSVIEAGTKLPLVKANVIADPVQLLASVIPVKLKEVTLIGSLKVSNRTLVVKSRSNDVNRGGVVSSV